MILLGRRWAFARPWLAIATWSGSGKIMKWLMRIIGQSPGEVKK
jgi:hypothetical protein